MITVLADAKAQLVQWIEANPEPKGEPHDFTPKVKHYVPKIPEIVMQGDLTASDLIKVRCMRKLATRGYEGYPPHVVTAILATGSHLELYEKFYGTTVWDNTTGTGKLKLLNPRCKSGVKIMATL